MQGAASETLIAPDFVVAGVRGDRLGEQEVDEAIVIAQQAQPLGEGQRLAALEGIGGRNLLLGWRTALVGDHGQIISKELGSSQAPSARQKIL